MRPERLRAALLAVFFLLAGVPAFAHRGVWLEQELRLERQQRAAREEAATAQLGAALRASLIAESSRFQTAKPAVFALFTHDTRADVGARVAVEVAPRPSSPAAWRPSFARSALPADDDSAAAPDRFRLACFLKTRVRAFDLVGGQQPQGHQQFSCEIASGLFQGAWTDPTTGLAYHRARWYDSRTASWLSEDPAGTVDSNNLYAYVGWGPQGAADPLGLRAPTAEDRAFLKGLSARESALRREYAATGSYGGTRLTVAEYEHALLDIRTQQESFMQAVAEAEEGLPVRGFNETASLTDSRPVTRFRPVPSQAAWERQSQEALSENFLYVQGPDIVATLLAVSGAAKMLAAPPQARAAVVLADEMEAGIGVARRQGVEQFWRMERSRLKAGQPGTRNWTEEQRADILAGRVPKDPATGNPIQGHHTMSVGAYPEHAADGSLIYPATESEHLKRWHGGSWRNDTHGVPLNPAVPEEF